MAKKPAFELSSIESFREAYLHEGQLDHASNLIVECLLAIAERLEHLTAAVEGMEKG